MKLFRDLSCEEEFYARQLAALHFPGSRENSGTRNPVFLLQQMREAYSTESLEEAYPPEEGDQFEYGDLCGNYLTFESLDELVKHHLELEKREAEFVPLKDAMESKGLNGQPVYDALDYVEQYGIDPDDITFRRLDGNWETMSIHFSRKEATRMRQSLDNHIFRPVTTYAIASEPFGRENKEYTALTGLIRKIGEQLLLEDGKNIGWQSGFILSENRVLDEYRNRPDRPFLLANFEAYVPAELSRDGKGAVWQIDVWAEGRIHTSGDKSFPVAKLSVKAYMGNNTPVEFLYPFECDGSGEALRAEKGESGFSGKERLLHYLRFAEKIAVD